MSSTIETFEQGNYYVEYRWDKHNGYELIVGTKYENPIYGTTLHTTYHNTYASKESAKKAFQRYVRKIKKGEY